MTTVRHNMKARALLSASFLLVLGCSGQGQTIGKFDTLEEQAEVEKDLMTEVATQPDLEVSPDLPTQFDLTTDSGPDATTPLCDPGEGCFLDTCDENGDCQSGWCVQHLGEKVCTISCQEECPPGWSCQQVAGTDPDLVFVCVSNYANLCRPCATSSDCTSIGGAEDACLDYGDEGAFCGGQCAENGDCPWGFSCQESTTSSGATLQQCVNDTGVCPCTESSIALGLSTPCRVSNNFGTCAGQRTCVESGLSGCDAPTPSAEVCDGLDNDCDGDIDEPDLIDGDFVNLCFDDNDCTKDICSGQEGCVNEIADEQDCSDSNPCTVADHCTQGVCAGDPVICEDENPCTDNVCTETGGCSYPPIAGNCDDENPCTVGDHCQEGVCSGAEVACDCLVDADCQALEDNDLCNGTLFCDTNQLPHKCQIVPASVVTCPAPSGTDAPCLMAECDPASGACSLVPDHQGWACDDGNPCTTSDTCNSGTCTAGNPANCNDGNPCTDDACDPDSGCVHTANTGGCDDGDDCTINDQCTDGVCLPGPAMSCDDGNLCTDDLCSAETGCQHTANSAACDDGNACTTGDLCSNGLCTFTGTTACNDDNPCTDDACDAATGCTFTMNQAPCDDGDVCTTGDHCQLGGCVGGANLTCNDANPCTTDSCDAGVGCQFTPNDASCNLASKCTTEDYCSGGSCHPGQPVLCDDGNPCTVDLCDPATGCTSKAVGGPCEDGNLCTISDQCDNGSCTAGEPRNCNDGNPCTDDSCVPDLGCVYTPNQAPCDDADPCSQTDVCADGQCVGGDPLDCSDGIFCNGLELCKAGFGCQPGPPPNTNDGIECTFDFCDEDNDVVVHEAQHDECATGLPCKNDYCHLETGCVSETLMDCCGNLVVEAGEECDAGVANANTPDTCRTNCQLPDCPDGIVDAGEECDDGNSNNGDNCKNDCTHQDLVEHYDGFNKFYNAFAVNTHSSQRAIEACQNYWGKPCSVQGCGGAQYVIGNHDVNCNNGATQRIWYFGTESCGYTCNNQDYAGWTIHPPDFGGKLPWY